MAMFEYVMVLASIIIGLALTHLLEGVARIIQHPAKRAIYWVHLTWVAFWFLTAIFWWWWEFRFHQTEVWSFQLYFFVLGYALLIYLICSLLFPRDMEGYQGFKDYFFSRRRWFFGLQALWMIFDFADSWLKGADYFASLGPQYVAVNLFCAALYIAAAFTRSELFHGLFALGMLANQLGRAIDLDLFG